MFHIMVLYFNEARDDQVAVASAGPHAPRCRQITTSDDMWYSSIG